MKNLFYVLVTGWLFASCSSPTSQNQSTVGEHPFIADHETAISNTESGQVAGYIHKGIYNYKGIPYAQAERFMPPQKPKPWEGVRSCRAYGPVCPINVESMILSDEMEFAQQHNFAYMNEDKCMNLNVWTPGINDGAKRPVMVWLHGGGYSAGSSCELPSYDGENLSKTGDVVVSINHRLNILGFLDLSEVSDKYAHSANVGMLDAVAALKWVSKNIENFGGDPNNVTIFGQSGGGGKVSTLLYMPSAHGLFHKAIMQSGGGGSFTTSDVTKKVGPLVLKELNIMPSEIEKINDVDYVDLLAAGNRALAKLSKQGIRAGWRPSVDGEIIPLQVGTPGAEDLSKNVPLIIGTNQCEFGTSMAFGAKVSLASEEQIIEMLKERYGDKTEAYVAAFKKAYPNTQLPSDMIDIDLGMRPNALKFASLKSSIQDGAPVYNYIFKWNAPHMDYMFKSMHCQEIAFVFNSIEYNEQYNGGTPEAYALADKLCKTWTTFARTGNPNNPEMPEWVNFTSENGATMLFDNVSELRYNHDKELLKVLSN